MWKGSTFVSALYNNTHCNATAIDNWSAFSGSFSNFDSVASKYITTPYSFIDADCFTTTVPDNAFTVYLFDGEHTYNAQRNAITYFWKNLADVAIIIIDDWNWEDVRRGTFDGFKVVGANVVHKHEIRHTQNKKHSPYYIARPEFKNGVGIFVIQK